MAVTLWPKTIGVVMEATLEQGTKQAAKYLLPNPIPDGWYA
jgi:hypothetical protein